jgi:hypothetical protein
MWPVKWSWRVDDRNPKMEPEDQGWVYALPQYWMAGALTMARSYTPHARTKQLSVTQAHCLLHSLVGAVEYSRLRLICSR